MQRSPSRQPGSPHLWLIGRVDAVAVRETFQTNGKADVAAAKYSCVRYWHICRGCTARHSRSNNVLDLEFAKASIKAQLLDDSSILATGQSRVVFALCARHHHLSTGKDQCSRLWLADTHDNGGKTLQKKRGGDSPAVQHASLSEILAGQISTFGLYSAFRACRAIVLRSRRTSRLTVATMFLAGQVSISRGQQDDAPLAAH